MTMVIKRDQERSQKYFKTQRPYNNKTKMIPVLTGAPGTTSKSL
jgi:hypothetical protein